MKFFNLDLHVSVIEDVSTMFEKLGHTVDSHLMSGHYWAFNKKRASAGTGEGPNGKIGYKSLHLDSWGKFFEDYPKLERVKAWQEECPELMEYDGFVANYPPLFALLYGAFPGHTIMNIPVRYEGPPDSGPGQPPLGFTNRPELWKDFNRRLADLMDSGKLSVVANSRYDAWYFTYFTGKNCKYISSTCSYIDKSSSKWAPITKNLLAFGQREGCRIAHQHVPQVHFVRDVIPKYAHAQVAKVAGVVWIPYNVSIMSFFEHYWLGIPMFVPSPDFLMDLAQRGLAMTEMSWHKEPRKGSHIEAGCQFPEEINDPHTDKGFTSWMSDYDFYNSEEFPFLIYFDSWADLEKKINETNTKAVSEKMLLWNEHRLIQNLARWSEILK